MVHDILESSLQVAQAEADFNLASQKLWNATIQLCQKLRPKTLWGWYSTPVPR
jgi:hypothetical protein